MRKARLARRTTAQRAAFLQQSGSRCPVYGPVNASPSKEGGIGGVHDGIDLKFCDISLMDFERIHDAVSGSRLPDLRMDLLFKILLNVIHYTVDLFIG